MMATPRQASTRIIPLPDCRRSVSLLLLGLLILALWLRAGTVHAGQTSLTWDAPVNQDGTPVSLGGYKVYRGTTSGNYSQNFNVGTQTTYTDSTVLDGTTYYYTVTAYDPTGNESGYSNEISKLIPASATPPVTSPKIAQSDWRLVYADSQETVAADRAAIHAFDGNPATLWITDWNSTNPPCPHEIQIDLGQSYDLDSFSYTPPQDGSVNGRIARYEFYVGSPGNWGQPVTAGTFTNDASIKTVLFPRTTGRYIRLRALAEVNGNPWTAVAELGVTGTATPGSTPASPTIPQARWQLVYADSQETVAADRAAIHAFDGNPATLWITDWNSTNPPCPHEIQIDLGQSYDLDSFSYTPPQDGSVNGRIAQYEFYVGSPGNWGQPVASGNFVNDASLKTVAFAKTTGRYIRLRALAEVNGNPWTSVAELNVTGVPTPGTSPAPSSPAAPQAGWSLLYADSQETKAANRAAVNAFDGKPATMWITDWATTNAPQPHEIQIDLGRAYDLDSFSYTPPQDGSVNGRIAQYEFYVSKGTSWGTPVASGRFANDATVKTVAFPKTTSRYIRLRSLAEVNGNPWTSMAELNVTGTPSAGSSVSADIPQTGWKLVYADSQETKAANRAAVNAFDGNTATMWITDWSTTNANVPHEIQIDLGQSYNLDSFSYLPPQDGSVNGRIAKYEFYVSNSTASWGTPVATGTFANDASLKKVSFLKMNGRYIRLRALSEVNGNPWTSAAEIRVTGTP